MSHTENGGSVTTGRCLERMESLRTELEGEIRIVKAESNGAIDTLRAEMQTQTKTITTVLTIGIALLGLLMSILQFLF